MNTLAQDCPDSCSYSFPTILTPNCDGIDCDVLEIKSNCSFTQFDFTIYNRWGEIIFHSSDSNERFTAGDNEEGTYIWTLKGEFCNAEAVERTGQLQIIR